jgi:hypothetical protein
MSFAYGKSKIPVCDTYNAYRLPSAGDTEALNLGGVNNCTYMTLILNLIKLLIKCVLYIGNEDNQCPKNTALSRLWTRTLVLRSGWRSGTRHIWAKFRRLNFERLY